MNTNIVEEFTTYAKALATDIITAPVRVYQAESHYSGGEDALCSQAFPFAGGAGMGLFLYDVLHEAFNKPSVTAGLLGLAVGVATYLTANLGRAAISAGRPEDGAFPNLRAAINAQHPKQQLS